MNEETGKIMADLTEDRQRVVLAKGGRGGRGNARFATSRNPAPQICERGEPGGKVAVYTGILPYTKDETGLAVVMSHEIAHAIAEHGREQASYSVLQNLGGSILNSMGLSTGIYNGASNLVLLSYSREHETEADELGLIFMKLAGYNPNYAITFWERMKSSSNNAQLEFLSTHPSDTTRINNIKNFLQSEKFKQIKK